MPKLTLSQASRAAGKSKTQISRLFESGKVSVEKDGSGRTVIDLSELQRVYPSANQEVSPLHRTRNVTGDKENVTVSAALQAQIDLLRDERDRLRVELDNERRERSSERDRLLGLVETAQRQLTDQRSFARLSWWDRLTGRVQDASKTP
ncbi:MAG: hypothetical protein JO264_22160 [Acidisphaera sp.]|nr:hypothetical protein [Acidisphaera sp.]